MGQGYAVTITDSQTVKNDIALVKLSGNGFDMSQPDIVTACLPTGADFSKSSCYVTGWGATRKSRPEVISGLNVATPV